MFYKSDTLNHFPCSEEALDLALNNNKGIVKVTIEEEETDYEETSHMMECSLISIGYLQGQEFTVDNKNDDVKGD